MAADLGLLALVFGGTFFGSFLGPILLDEYREFRREGRWRKPRKALLLDKLKNNAGISGWVRLSRLTALTGTTDDECRSLLISINARGGTLKSDKADGEKSDNEGWALISRQPVSSSGNNAIDDSES